MVYVVGFNGPPSSGKDTVARALRDKVEESNVIATKVRALAWPMRKYGMELLGLDPYDAEAYGDAKGTAQILFGGMTLREFMIDMSEKYMKPKFGRGFWAKTLCEQPMFCSGLPGLVIVTDVGFWEEVAEFEMMCEPTNYLTVQLSRGAWTFESDSRSYVYGSNNFPAANNASAGIAAALIHYHLTEVLGWKL